MNEELNQEARGKIKAAEALGRLANNDDFKAVVLDGYFEKEAIRLTELLSYEDKNRESLIEQLVSISNFRYYLNRIRDDGYAVAQYIRDYQEGIDNA